MKTFFELLNRADLTATEEKIVITYKADGNGTKTVKKSLINLAILYNDKSIDGMYVSYSEPKTAVIYKDFSPCWEVQTIYNDTESDKMKIALIRYNQAMGSYADFCDMIQNRINNGYYIKNNALMLLQLHGSKDLLLKATKAKQVKIEATAKAEEEDARRRAEEERKQAEAERVEGERRKAEKRAFLEGFADGKTDIQTERLFDILSKVECYDIDGRREFLSRKDFIIQILNRGGRAEKKEGIVTHYGSKWNPKESKPKTEYRLYTEDNSFYTITKTEFSFAEYLKQKAIA